MRYFDWTPTVQYETPVYIDANVLVGAVVQSQPIYSNCVNLLADLLINQSRILVSPLSIQESLWAIAKLSYCDLTHQRSGAHFNAEVYRRWCSDIFKTYGSRMAAVPSMLTDFVAQGASVELIPNHNSLWNRTLQLTPGYMQQCRLTPMDALHLALAETHARTFITADSDFSSVAQSLPAVDLIVLHVPRP